MFYGNINDEKPDFNEGLLVPSYSCFILNSSSTKSIETNKKGADNLNSKSDPCVDQRRSGVGGS